MTAHSSFPSGSSSEILALQVQRQFKLWRDSRSPGVRRIPEELWVAATELAAKTTVHQVARWLSLGYSQLKNRVVEICGANCSALPGRPRVNKDVEISPLAVSYCEQAKTVAESAAKASTVSKATTTSHPSSRLSLPREKTHAFLVEGFLEAKDPVLHPCVSPLLLAEIQSPSGNLLRIFSNATESIIAAFLHS